MKKLISLVIVALMVLVTLAGCTKPAEPSQSSESASVSQASAEASTEASTEASEKTGENNLIILSNAYYTAAYCVPFNAGAIAKGKELGYEVQVLDGEQDQTKQLEQAKLAIETAVGFIYFPADVEGSTSVIEALQQAEFPYVVINNYTKEAVAANNIACYVGADVTKHGENMAQAVIDLLPDGGNIVAVEGTAGHAQTIAFNQVFDEKFTADTGIKWLDRQDGDFDSDVAGTKMTDMITRYGDQIALIISHSGDICAGIISALESAGYGPGDIPIVTAGSNESIKEGIQDGWITCTSTQDPSTESALGVETLVKILKGQPVDQIITINEDLCYIDDLDNYNWF
jgi:ABC-type sugar transport system substrate-binding protein